MIVNKVDDINLFKQNMRVEKNISFNTRKKIEATEVFEKDLYILAKTAFLLQKRWKI